MYYEHNILINNNLLILYDKLILMIIINIIWLILYDNNLFNINYKY